MERNIKLPTVTVLIAHHNYEQYLANAIDSALEQTYPNIRICVVDDCSKNIDAVKKICGEKLAISNMLISEDKEYYDNDDGSKSLICLTKTSAGPSAARNAGILYTLNDTDIYAILDADDIMHPQKIEACASVMMRNMNNIGVVYADYHILNVDTGNIQYEYKEPYDFVRLREECIVHSGSLINKKALIDVAEGRQFYDEAMRTCEDYDLWIRISEKYMIYHLAEPLTMVRVHNQNSTNTVRQEIWNQNWSRIRQKIIMRNEKKIS